MMGEDAHLESVGAASKEQEAPRPGLVELGSLQPRLGKHVCLHPSISRHCEPPSGSSARPRHAEAARGKNLLIVAAEQVVVRKHVEDGAVCWVVVIGVLQHVQRLGLVLVGARRDAVKA